ncbi:MAG: CPBP family intramembrane metalloprotease [Myxococcales bacterium]|jgi:membrane protease YdiL (CAAX protease family)|nr:CPBP family intramembrane metalloprotease [Myxococcales bacterium]
MDGPEREAPVTAAASVDAASPPEPAVAILTQPERRGRIALEIAIASVVVTALVTAASMTMPDRYVATTVGFIFLGATWALVWRKDDGRVVASGLSLGGVVLPGERDPRRMLLAAGRAVAWAGAFAAVVFVPFFFGWRWWWHPKGAFAVSAPWYEIANEAIGQLVIIALPEEAFYRGYLQSRIDDALPGRARLFGAEIGWGILVASVIFALGHVATIHQPARLAVFFPSLLFGWMRARTRGVGAGVVFHASCNVFSELLGRGYGLY